VELKGGVNDSPVAYPTSCRDPSSIVREPARSASSLSVCAVPGVDSVTMWERGRQVPMPEGRPKLAVRRSDNKDSFRIVNSHLAVVSSARGFVVTVGPVSVLLDREAAEELTCLLVDALEPTEPSEVSTTDSN